MKDIKLCPACNSADSKTAYRVDNFHIVKCRKCRLVYLQNPPDNDILYEQYYSNKEPNSEEYSRNSKNHLLSELWNINQQRLINIKKLMPQGSLLDIGCGYGFFLKSAAEAGYSVNGIDISKGAVRYAENVLHVPASLSTIDELVSENKSFHIITLWHVLEHFSDPYQTLRSIKALLHENGICFIEVPNLHSLKFILSKKKWHGGNHPLYHRTFFTASTLRRAFEETGFSQIARLKMSYTLPGRNYFYERIKKGLNIIACDAFLDYAIRR